MDTSLLIQINSFIQQAVRNVDKQVDEHKDNGNNEYGTLDNRKIACPDGIDRQTAHAIDRKNSFCQHGTAKKSSKYQAENGHNGNQCIFQRMPLSNQAF